MDRLTGRIVVGYDGSEQSGTAVDWAATEAERRGIPLTVVHVVDYLGVMPNAMGPSGWPAVFADQAAKVAETGAARARSRSKGLDVDAVTEINGVTRTLIEYSEDATLLVVGTHGRGNLPGTVLGSVAFAVTGHAPCPVVVVRGEADRPAGPDRPVIVGFDGSPGAILALEFAADVAADIGAPLTVITAYHLAAPWIQRTASYLSSSQETERVNFEAFSRETVQRVSGTALRIAQERHPKLSLRTRAIDGPAVEILTSAATRASQLVIGARGHGGFAGLLLGSIGHGLIHSSPCPVVVVPGSLRQSVTHPVSSVVPRTV